MARLIRTVRHFAAQRDGMPVVALAYLLDVPAKSQQKVYRLNMKEWLHGRAALGSLTDILTQPDEEN
jgi:hypothetical protein